MNHLTPRQIIANEICNTINLVDHYPLVYQMAWNIMYKGKITKTQVKQSHNFQKADPLMPNYVPAEIINKLWQIIR
jgi:hypothetical protein